MVCVCVCRACTRRCCPWGPPPSGTPSSRWSCTSAPARCTAWQSMALQVQHTMHAPKSSDPSCTSWLNTALQAQQIVHAVKLWLVKAISPIMQIMVEYGIAGSAEHACCHEVGASTLSDPSCMSYLLRHLHLDSGLWRGIGHCECSLSWVSCICWPSQKFSRSHGGSEGWY